MLLELDSIFFSGIKKSLLLVIRSQQRSPACRWKQKHGNRTQILLPPLLGKWNLKKKKLNWNELFPIGVHIILNPKSCFMEIRNENKKWVAPCSNRVPGSIFYFHLPNKELETGFQFHFQFLESDSNWFLRFHLLFYFFFTCRAGA